MAFFIVDVDTFRLFLHWENYSLRRLDFPFCVEFDPEKVNLSDELTRDGSDRQNSNHDRVTDLPVVYITRVDGRPDLFLSRALPPPSTSGGKEYARR